MSRLCLRVFTSLVLGGMMMAFSASPAAAAPPWEQSDRKQGNIDPQWSTTPPKRELTVSYDPEQTTVQNGRQLISQLNQLQPGDRLLIAPGRYELDRKVSLNPQGTMTDPIVIEAADADHPPEIFRADAAQNLLNIGERGPARFLALRNLNLHGGSVVIRLGDCQDIWLDRCEIHHGQHGGLTANTHHTSHLFLTRNHLHHFEHGTGEAMYLGGNHSQVRMTNSIIARNRIHDCSGSQGDGIEVKQGSYDNWIFENEVEATKYPCLIVYGTDGLGINLVERNRLYGSRSQTLQVQGEAIVRNNLIFAPQGTGFTSTDHQGKTRDLRFIHNTIIAVGRGANLSSWGNREGMVFANNAIYSRDAAAVRFPTGCQGVEFAGNVVFGRVEGCPGLPGFRTGKGLDDFVSVDWDAKRRDATPALQGELTASADAKFTVSNDLLGKARRASTDVGAIEH